MEGFEISFLNSGNWGLTGIFGPGFERGGLKLDRGNCAIHKGRYL